MTTHYSHQYLITIQIFENSQTHTTLGKQQAGIFMFWQFALFNNQVPPSPTAAPWHPSQPSHYGALRMFLPLESASRSVNNYSKPFFGLCHDFWVPFKKNKRLSSKQNKSALSPQLTALCMELKQNYKMETEKSTVFILPSFYCICSEKLDFWGWLFCEYPKKLQDCTWH